MNTQNPIRNNAVAALAAAALSAAACGSQSSPEPVAKTDTTTVSAPKKHKPLSAKQRVRAAVRHADASGWVGKLKVQKIENGSTEMDVYVRTPEGGISGASWDDLDNGAGAIFRAAYKAGWHKSINVVFRGGLVDSTTGESLPHVNTGIYGMTGTRAERIDWDNSDIRYTVDWSNYRKFAHPALKH
jgi:hypothetical protein